MCDWKRSGGFTPHFAMCGDANCVIEEPHGNLSLPSGITAPYYSKEAARGCLGHQVVTGKLTKSGCLTAVAEINESPLPEKWCELDTATQETLAATKANWLPLAAASITTEPTEALARVTMAMLEDYRQSETYDGCRFVAMPPYIRGYYLLGLTKGEALTKVFQPMHTSNGVAMSVKIALEARGFETASAEKLAEVAVKFVETLTHLN